MRTLVLVVMVLGACGSEPPARSPQQQTLDSATAVAAIRAGNFVDARREASAVLTRDPRNSQAAAVRAIARYQDAGSKLIKELGAVIETAESFKAFDHQRGRTAWTAFVSELEAVDRDLAIVAADPSFALEVCLACWKYDWNHSGTIDERDEKMLELEFDGKGGELAADDPRRRPTFRFDTGDALWARAMLSFQRAGVELVLAYRWSELDKLFAGNGDRLVIPLIDGNRVKHARELVLVGLGFADATRQAYLAETDDDREWVPNPRQRSYSMPLEVNDKLYATWGAVIGDVHGLLASRDGVSMREVAVALVGQDFGQMMPNAYLDLGRMLREPKQIVIDLRESKESPDMYERVLRGLLGNGYAESMRASPLVGRLRHMKEELERGEDTFERKLRYLFWLN